MTKGSMQMKKILLLTVAVLLAALCLVGCGLSGLSVPENEEGSERTKELKIEDFALYVGKDAYSGQPVVAQDGVIYFSEQETQVNTRQGIQVGDTFADVVHAYQNYEPTSVQNLASFDFEFKSLEDCLSHFDEYYTEGAIHFVQYTYYQIDGKWLEANKALESYSQEELDAIGRYDLTFMFRDKSLIEISLEIPA